MTVSLRSKTVSVINKNDISEMYYKACGQISSQLGDLEL